jgi:transglutaminase-like putative cysteine protease
MRARLIPVLLLFACVAAYGANDPPDWARQAAARAVPRYPVKVTAVVLFHEESLTVEPDGRRTMRERQAVKILQRSSDNPIATRTYNVKSGRIRDFQAWLISPAGKADAYDKNRILDVAVSQDAVYDEARAKILEPGDVPSGSVFAWEIIEEEKTSFVQSIYEFQRDLPVVLSRFVLTVPPSWEAEGVVFNWQTLAPQQSGNTFTWELRDLPWTELEDFSPPRYALVPRLAVSYYPPTGNRAGLPSLGSWPSVSQWLSQLVDPAAEVTAPIRTKAAQLTANSATEIEKIRAIAAFVQQTNYVNVQLNITKGGGYTPRRAEETLARNYGDCKDKATLMRALLKAVEIDSYLTTIFAGNRNFVRPEWPSPMQFNHAIIAIRVPESVALPTVIDAPGIGRLLMFDPTDSITPPGDLPDSEQGSNALIVGGQRGALLKMPQLPPSANRIESSAEVAMDAAGRIEASLQQEYFGQSSKSLTAVRRLGGEEELKRRLERQWSRQIIGTTLDSIKTADQPERNSLQLELRLKTDHFAEVMQDRLMVVRPGMLSTAQPYILPSKERNTPIEFDGTLHKDLVIVKIPAGFKLDEMPVPMKIETPYGTLDATWTVMNNELLFQHTIEIRTTTAPATEYPQVREFFDRIGAALGAPVIFIRE